MTPLRLPPSFREKIWGSTALEPWFCDSDRRIGEVWFTTEELPILAKFLFTSERLSIQVHPRDEYARGHENSAGKTEMWYVLRAGPGAAIGAGFVETLTRERLRQAALSGEIERLLRWIPVRAGDTIFTPAGTVHAIGADLALCEIQQLSDVTYRLYDYGRPRELHLDKSLDVADLGPHPGIAAPQPLSPGRTLLASCPYFAVELLEAPFELVPDCTSILIAIEGRGSLGNCPVKAGEAWLVPASAGPLTSKPDGSLRLLRSYVPAS
jgi:mannose-6-phosphate isomerase